LTAFAMLFMQLLPCPGDPGHGSSCFIFFEIQAKSGRKL